MDFLKSALDAFFAFKPYVMLPIIVLLIALISRISVGKALMAALKVGVGFAGIFLVFDLFISIVKPAVASIVQVRGLNFPVVDTGWPPLAAITWASPIAPITILLVIVLNVLMLVSRTTKTLYIDVWNYWHFAFAGALVEAATESLALALIATLATAIYTIKCAEWSVPFVKRELGIDGIAISPLSVVGFLPWGLFIDRLFDKIPGLRRLNYDPSRAGGALKSIGEPMLIGFLVGVFLSTLAGYDFKKIAEFSIETAAIMFILPKCGGLIGDAMGSISMALQAIAAKRFKKLGALSIAMDTGILMTNPSVMATGIILMPISLGIAFVLPGNGMIPAADLTNLMSIFSVMAIVTRGNVIRAVLASIPIVTAFLLIATNMAPVFTELAQKAGTIALDGALVTAFTDGGVPWRYWLYWLFQGNITAILVTPLVLALTLYAWRRHKKGQSLISGDATENAS